MSSLGVSVKDALVQALARDSGLTAKELHGVLKLENRAHAPTYQAVHKTLQQLEKNNDVDRANARYSLSSAYIAKLDAHLTEAKQRQGTTKRISLLDLKPGQTETIEFNETVAAPYYWTLHEMDKLRKHYGPTQNIVFYMNGIWPANIMTEKEYNILTHYLNGANLTIIRYHYPEFDGLDRAFTPLWQEFGAKIITRKPVNIPVNIDYLITRDYVLAFEQEKSVVEGFRQLAKIIPKFIMPRTYRYLFEQKGKIKLHATRNQILANHYYQDAKQKTK